MQNEQAQTEEPIDEQPTDSTSDQSTQNQESEKQETHNEAETGNEEGTDAEGDSGDSGEKSSEESSEEAAGEPEWAEQTDTALAGIQDVLKDGGFTPDEASAVFAKALETGDIKDIDEAALKDKLGDAKAHLVLAGAKDYYERNLAATQNTVQQVYEVFGGEQNFEVVKEWAQRQEADNPAFQTKLDELRTMFDQGGFAAQAAAKELQSMYNNDENTSSPDVKMESGDKGTNTASMEPINRTDYLSEVKKAYKANDSALVASLHARRRATMKREQG